jgi:flagellar secretion chaperone FliS
MYASASQAYLESRVLSADPLELVRVMYGAAMENVREARRHLAGGDIAARSRCISKAAEIIVELSCSLDPARGVEIAVRLAQIYSYLQRRLLEANCDQQDAPLAEALGLLSTLSEAWEGIRPEPAPQAEAPSPWAIAPTPELAGASHSWSL